MRMEVAVEYGIFSEPSFNWTLIGAAIACTIIFLALLSLIFFGLDSLTKSIARRHAKRYETKRAILPNAASKENLIVKILEQVNGSDATTVTATVLLFGSFIAIWPLLGVGLHQKSVNGECNQAYASPGIYRIVDAKLAYTYDFSRILVKKDDPRITSGEYGSKTDSYGETYLTDKPGQYYIQTFTPKKPDHYELRLAGRTDPSLPLTVNRCIVIPYDQVSENQKFTPTAQQTQEINQPKPLEVQAPPTIEKYGDKWWKFKE